MATPPSVFVAPDHAGDENSRIPDLRNTLFWDGNPEREPGPGLAVEFLSPDDSQLCEITVTIVDRDGEVISAREKFVIPGVTVR